MGFREAVILKSCNLQKAEALIRLDNAFRKARTLFIKEKITLESDSSVTHSEGKLADTLKT